MNASLAIVVFSLAFSLVAKADDPLVGQPCNGKERMVTAVCKDKSDGNNVMSILACLPAQRCYFFKDAKPNEKMAQGYGCSDGTNCYSPDDNSPLMWNAQKKQCPVSPTAQQLKDSVWVKMKPDESPENKNVKCDPKAQSFGMLMPDNKFHDFYSANRIADFIKTNYSSQKSTGLLDQEGNGGLLDQFSGGRGSK